MQGNQTRKPMVAGNWKCNLTYSASVNLSQLVVDGLRKAWRDEVDVLMCPAFTSLRGVGNVIDFDHSWAQVGAQDVSLWGEGAYTGEVSASQLKDLDCTWCIVGHSERRGLLGETDAVVAAKCKVLLEAGIAPIVCVGEPREVYDAGTTLDYVCGQLRASLEDVKVAGGSIAVAYEPIWAIGSGQVPTPGHAQEVACALRQTVADGLGPDVAASCRILYGGSVRPANVAGFMAQPDVDGVLVGGASLDADSFVQLVAEVAHA